MRLGKKIRKALDGLHVQWHHGYMTSAEKKTMRTTTTRGPPMNAENLIDEILDGAGQAGGSDEIDSIAKKGYQGDLSEEAMAVLLAGHGTPGDALYAIQLAAQRLVSLRSE